MATFKVLLDTRHQLKDETYPLIIRVYSGRTRKEINLKTYLKENQFDSTTQRVKKGHPNEKIINLRIKQAIIQVQEAKLNLEMRSEIISATKIKNTIVKPTPKLNFIQYGIKISEAMQAVKRIGNASAYMDALNALQTYSGKADLQFAEVNYELLCSIEYKMLMKGRKKNSIAAYNRVWRAIFNKAINENLIDIKFYPYRKYKIKGESTAKRNISKEDIAAITHMDIQPNSALWHSRNYFILSFNLRGISFADMIAIKSTDIIQGRLIYKRKKTHKLYSIKLTDKAKEILEYYQQPSKPYLLPALNAYIDADGLKLMEVTRQAIKNCNKYLKLIGEELKLPLKLSTYVSRHSWATIAKKMGYSKDLISEALGHSFGNRVTEIYLDGYDMELIDAMNEAVCKL